MFFVAASELKRIQSSEHERVPLEVKEEELESPPKRFFAAREKSENFFDALLHIELLSVQSG